MSDRMSKFRARQITRRCIWRGWSDRRPIRVRLWARQTTLFVWRAVYNCRRARGLAQ